MKIFKTILLVILICGNIFAISDKPSRIELPKSIFLNTDYQDCDNVCLIKLTQNEKFFSFLAKYKDSASTKYTQENYLIYGQMFNIFIDVDTQTIRLAILVPQKTIKNYAVTSINAAIAYLLRQSNDFDLAVFNSGDESEESLIKTLKEIRKNGYRYVIAPITQNGAKTLFENSDGFYIFIPTLHRSLFEEASYNIIFGGIDYNAQIEALESFSGNFTAAFSDESKLGFSLNQAVKNQNKTFLQETIISSPKENLKKYFEKNKNFSGSSIYLNTPLITSSLIASQIRVYKHAPFSLLSTQINYQPSLLIFTQYEDRQNLYLANSIGKIDSELDSINAFLGNNLEYEYVNYAVSIGAEYFGKYFFADNLNSIFKEQVGEDNQVQYDTKIYKAERYGFSPQIKPLIPQNYDF